MGGCDAAEAIFLAMPSRAASILASTAVLLVALVALVTLFHDPQQQQQRPDDAPKTIAPASALAAIEMNLGSAQLGWGYNPIKDTLVSEIVDGRWSSNLESITLRENADGT